VASNQEFSTVHLALISHMIPALLFLPKERIYMLKKGWMQHVLHC
jgi:hypothetical protein